MLKILNVLVVLLFVASSAVAQSDSLAVAVTSESVMTKQEADSLYDKGLYAEAAKAYEDIISNNGVSADLYYNVANCHYRKGELAASILNYERALKLDPSHEDAKHNLAFAAAKTVDNINVIGNIFLVNWWNAICNIASADTWAMVSIVLFVITLVALSFYIFSRKIWVRKFGFSVSIIALFFTIISLFSANTRYNVETSKSQAIVFAQTVTIKSSPDSSGNDLFILHEGTKVNIKKDVTAKTKAGAGLSGV